jgi:hypothetical protein
MGSWISDILVGILRYGRPQRRRLRFEALESRNLLSVTSARPVGDVNGDGIVNTQDLAQISANWLQQGNLPLSGDANLDGIVNSQDLAIVASQYGKSAGGLGLGDLTPPTAVEGATYTNFTVSHFSDTDQAAKASDYTALVSFGDGTRVNLSSTPSAGGRIIADPDGGFDVQISHVYSKTIAGGTFTVQVDGADGQTTLIGTDTFAVADAPLTAGNLTPPVATQNQFIKNATIFNFSDANPLATADAYKAVVNLGDGNQVTLTSTLSKYGRIAADPAGGFDVQLSYTYATSLANQTFGVTVSDGEGMSASASTNSFSVVPSSLLAGSLTPPTAVVGTPITSAVIFHFTSTDAAATAGTFSALVTLGDGKNVILSGAASALGQIVANPAGGFDVQLTYTYATPVQNQTFGVVVTNTKNETLNDSTTRFSVTTTPVQITPQIQLDATNTSTVATTPGGALFSAAQSQYMTEPDNATLDGVFNGATQLTIEFQARQTTLAANRNFLSKWNFGSNGTMTIATGEHAGGDGEISVWFATASGNVAGVVETQGANLQASVTYDIAVVFNAGQVQVYVNGQLQQTVVAFGAVPTSLAASSGIPLDLGRWNGMGNYIDGALANLNIWTIAKSQSQIQSLNGDTLSYAQMNASQRAGLAESFALSQASGPATDDVTGQQMLNPTGVVREQIVTSWRATGSMPIVFTPSPEGQAPDLVASVPSMNGQAALKFNGINDALKYASTVLPSEDSGDVFIVAQFTGGGDNFEGDTLFSASSDTTPVDYVFFASYNPASSVVPASVGGGVPLPRFRFRDDTFQTDVRGSQVVLEPGVTYVMHFWGLGTGNGYGMTINGLDVSPFYSGPSAQPAPGFDTVAGSWFGASANLTNLTIGDFERSDGAQGFAAALISEIDVYAGTAAQPVLPLSVAQQIVNRLLAKYGATPLGNDG